MRVIDALIAFTSFAGLCALGYWQALMLHEKSAPGLEARLRESAESALARDGFGWARVAMDGQVARVSGDAPSPEALEAARFAVLTSSGPGGLLFGGVVLAEIDRIGGQGR